MENSYGTMNLAKYVKGNTSITIPVFTFNFFLAPYLNKWGYLQYFGINPIYINVDFTQLIPSMNNFLLWIIFFSFVGFVIILDKYSDKIQKENEKKKRNHYYLTAVKKNPYRYFINRFNIPWYLEELMACNFLICFIMTYSFRNFFYVYILLSIISCGVLCFILLLTKSYMLTMVAISFWICFSSYQYGHYQASEMKVSDFDRVNIKGNKFLVIDYFNDKYILIKEDTINTTKPPFEIHSVINEPLKIVR